MRPNITVSVLLAAGLIMPGAVALESSTAHAAGDVLKCRSQTYTWTHGKKTVLTSAVGPRIRGGTKHAPTLTDERINAAISPADNQPGALAAEYLNVLTPNIGGQKVSRLESVTLYPDKGHAKTYKIVTNPNKDFVYKYGMIKTRGQVQLPVRGSNGTEHAIPKLKKVIVRARENCFATQ